jgi:outer membrane biosynthesis protein TonB
MTMRTGPVLASDLVDKYQPLGVFGQPVYMSYVQLRATIAQKLGTRHANYFARPDRDPQNKSVHWISEVAGTARRWVDLPPEEQTRYAVDLQAMRSDFIRYVDELRRKGDGSTDGKAAAAFASLLQEAMLVPDDSHLHFVGDQPVVSFWGFRNFGGQAIDPLAVAPSRPALAATAAPPQEGVALPFQAPRRPWWRWLLWALGLLLLLLLLLLGLYTCLPEEDRAVLFGDQGSERPVEAGQAVAPEGGIVGRALRYLGFESAVWGVDVAVPGGEVQTGPGAEVATPPGAEQPVPDASAPAAEGPQDQKSDQQSQEPPQPPDQTSSAKDQATPEPPQPQPQQDQKPPPQPQQDQGGKQQGANDRSLQIPPDAAKTGNTGFIGGEWRSDKGLVDQVTKQPLQQAYRFDTKGNGEVVIRRADGVECRAGAQARMQGGQLSINELGDPRCPDGRTFSRSKTECMRTPSGQTVCQGRNADGSTYRVGIERQQAKP